MTTQLINITGFSGTAILTMGPGTATSNYITGSFNFKKVGFSKPSGDDAKVSLDFESNGAVALNGFTDTGTNMSAISGWGGNVTLPSGFNIEIGAWSADLNIDTVQSQSFNSPWKNSSITGGQLTGSCSGRVKTGLPVPTTT